MTKYNKEYYQSEDGYSDGVLEDELYERLDSGESAEEILESDSRWPVYYHLSPKRENILSWYPFKEDAKILEVGSGLGALTGLLVKKGEVTSVELTDRRARVNLKRHPDAENLEIMVGNIWGMDFEKKYDYIILNGVLEYAGSFSDSESPYEDFLKLMKSLLKPDGTLLIAIENRFGLKYFNGTPEDHTGELFSGIDNYQKTGSVKTFSKKDLTDLLERSGFDGHKFYYPTPDYKFPEVIYTDETLDLVDPRVETDVFNINRVRFFDETEVTKSFLNEGILDRFFNSYLVEAGFNEKSPKTEVLYTKISDKRAPEFSTVTTILEEDGKRFVKKSPGTKEAKEHLQGMLEYYKNNPENMHYKNVPVREDGESLLFDFIDGETLEKALLTDIKKGETEAFKGRLKSFSEEILKDTELRDDYYTDAFREVFGNRELHTPLHVKRGSNLDLIFTNIILSDNDYIIDYEWIMDFDLPQEFVIWRALYYFYLSNLKATSRIEDLMEIVGLDPELHETFLAWDEHFGNRAIKREVTLPKKETIDALPALTEMIGRDDKFSSLYLDFGAGESEEGRILEEVLFDGENFSVTFDLSEGLKNPERLKRIRWDPLERALSVKDIKVETDGEELIVCPDPNLSGQVVFGNSYTFLEDDPHLYLLGDYEGTTKITISGKIKFLDSGELREVVEKYIEKSAGDKENLRLKRRLLKEKNFRIHELEKKLSGVENE